MEEMNDMKRLQKYLSLALCAAAVLSLPALAAGTEAVGEGAAVFAEEPPVRLWGTVSRLENGKLLLENSDENDPFREAVIHIGAAMTVDYATGYPMDAEKIRDGDTVYAWAGPAMTLSLPPQLFALVVVGNIPADAAAPRYMEAARIGGAGEGADAAAWPCAGCTAGMVVSTGGEELLLTTAAQFLPWRTRRAVTLFDVVPGTRFLAWTGTDGSVSRVLLFPYTYRGYGEGDAGPYLYRDENGLPYNGSFKLAAAGDICAPLPPGMRVFQERAYLPLRAAAERLGLSVVWEKNRGAVVSENGAELFSVLPGSESVLTAEGEMGLTGACVIEKGVTYLPAADLARLLNVTVYLDGMGNLPAAGQPMPR